MLPTAQLQTFEHAYRAEGPYVAAVLGRLSVPTEAVHDALQDVFVAAYHRWDDFDDSRPVRPWLTGFARKVAFRYRRSAARRSRKRAAVQMIDKEGAPAPAQRVVARDFLGRFLETLDEGHREAFVRAELEGKTAREIAEELSIGVEAVYGRVRTARKRLKVALMEDAREPSARAASMVPPWGLMLTRLGEGGTAAAAAGTGLLSAASLKAMAVVVVVGALGLGAAKSSVEGETAKTPRTAVGLPVAAVGSPQGAASRAASKPPSTPAPVEGAAPSVLEHAEQPVPAVVAPAIETAARASASSRGQRSSRSRSPEGGSTTGSLGQESALLRRARDAQTEGNFKAALARLDEHERRFPNGQLADGRRRSRIRVLCDLGRTAQARGEAQKLAKERPNDPLAQQALSICAP